MLLECIASLPNSMLISNLSYNIGTQDFRDIRWDLINGLCLYKNDLLMLSFLILLHQVNLESIIINHMSAPSS